MVVGLALPAAAAGEMVMPPANPPTTNPANLRPILQIARDQLRRKVSERRSDNVPRYRNGKGRIAPFSIGDQWCVAFGTWVWSRAGFSDYLGARYIWRSRDGTSVAIQVTDISRWAANTAHWSARAKPGYLVAYDFSHIGIVTRVDRDGQAVEAIEGNKGDRVRRVQVPMANVTGYISPTVLSTGQIVNAIAHPDMDVPDPIEADPMAFAVSSTGE